MNGRIRVVCLFIVSLLAVGFTAAEVRALEPLEEAVEAAPGRPLVYDYKTGTFVRAHRLRPSQYRLGKYGVDVGYDERVHRSKDAWPYYNVNQFLFKRPLDQ